MDDLKEILLSPRSWQNAFKEPRRTYHFLRSILHENPNPQKTKEELRKDFYQSQNGLSSELASLIGIDSSEIQSYFDEAQNNIDPNIIQKKKEFENKPFTMSGIDNKEAHILYASLRALKPKKVVEIGIANGASSYYILSALEKNSRGNLISIDIPKYEEEHQGDWNKNAGAWIPSGKSVGWVVPEDYRDRWDLRIGDMRKLLPEVIESNQDIDAFIYDGPKWYYTRFWAFRHIKNNLHNVGFYFCDDIAWNDSFSSFANKFSLKHMTFGNVGIGIDATVYTDNRN